MIYRVECPECGFEYDLLTDDEGIKSELEQCDCGGKCKVEMEREREEKS